jgi:hypothetical protein
MTEQVSWQPFAGRWLTHSCLGLQFEQRSRFRLLGETMIRHALPSGTVTAVPVRVHDATTRSCLITSASFSLPDAAGFSCAGSDAVDLTSITPPTVPGRARGSRVESAAGQSRLGQAIGRANDFHYASNPLSGMTSRSSVSALAPSPSSAASRRCWRATICTRASPRPASTSRQSTAPIFRRQSSPRSTPCGQGATGCWPASWSSG